MEALRWCVDQIYRIWPRRIPDRETLQQCRVVSHRGQHDNRSVRENTLAAFDAALHGGVWGIEANLRWTHDLEPVVIHDPDCRRVFGVDLTVSRVSLADLNAVVPEVPTLEELIEQYGKRLHLMLEIKQEAAPDPDKQKDRLKALLTPLKACEDFHILSLHPTLFSRVDFLPKQALLPVAELNVGEISRTALQEGYGGLAGHFLLLNRSIQQRHVQAGQAVGTGFVASKNCLFREIHRGIDWIFSNHAVELQGIIKRAVSTQRSAVS